MPIYLQILDGQLLDFGPRSNLSGLRRFSLEFLYFGIKEARACLFISTTRRVEIPKSDWGMGRGPSWEMEFLVTIGHHDLYHRREAEAHQEPYSRSGLA
jgi:hypothetical protein